MDEMLVLRLEVEVGVEGGELEAFAHAEHTLLAHLEEDRVVLAFGPRARFPTLQTVRRNGRQHGSCRTA